MTETFRAAVCKSLTGPDSIQVLDQTRKPLMPGEIRIAVKVAGLNFPDLLMTYGKYQFRPDPPFVPGMDAAGEVVEVAPDASIFKIGDRVMAGSKGGTFAERMVVPETAATILPKALNYEEGCCCRLPQTPHGMVSLNKANCNRGKLF